MVPCRMLSAAIRLDLSRPLALHVGASRLVSAWPCRSRQLPSLRETSRMPDAEAAGEVLQFVDSALTAEEVLSLTLLSQPGRSCLGAVLAAGEVLAVPVVGNRMFGSNASEGSSCVSGVEWTATSR